MFPLCEADRALNVIAPVWRRNWAIENELLPTPFVAAENLIFGQREAEGRKSLVHRSAAHQSTLCRTKEHLHLMFAAAEGQRGCRQVRNIIHMFAQNVDSRRCAPDADFAVA